MAQALTNQRLPFPYVIPNDTLGADAEGNYPFRSIPDSRSELVVPIKDGSTGQVLCVFNFQSRNSNFFNSDHAAQIYELSPLAIMTIRLVRHFQHYHSLALHTNYFSKMANSVNDPKKLGELLLELVVEVGRGIAHCKYGYVLIRDPSSADDKLHIGIALPPGQRPADALNAFRPGEGHVGQAILRRETVVCEDTEKSANYIPGWPGVRSEVAIPVFDMTRWDTRKLTAVLLYAHTEPNYFRPNTQVIVQLQELAEQLGNTIPKLSLKAAPTSTTATTKPSAPASVFISYPSSHEPFAEDLYRVVKRLGYHALKDTYEVAPSDNISNRLLRIVEGCDLFVVLLTPAAAASRWVAMEMDYAAAHGKRILPVEMEPMSDDVANAVPHVPRNTTHWLRAPKGIDDVIEWVEQLLGKAG